MDAKKSHMARILIADDDELVREVVCETLMDAGHIAGALNDGRHALAVVRQRKPDLLILDCNMPELNGLLVLRELRKLPEFYDLPVLILTARTSDKDVALAHYDGADEYMKKPFDPDALVFLVETMLARRAAPPALRRRSAHTGFGRAMAR